MNFDRLNQWLTLTANIGVLLGIVFVGFEVQQNTTYLRRAEMNTTMDQISLARMAVMDPELAELVARGNQSDATLSPVDRMRLGSYYAQWMWTAYQLWDREQGGFVDAGEFDRGGRGIVVIFSSPTAYAWWQGAKQNFPPEYVTVVDEMLAGMVQ